MTDQDLTHLLERAVTGVQVGPPPIDEVIRARAGVRRRRRQHASVGVGVGVITVCAVASLVATRGPDKAPPVMQEPQETRHVGLGRLVAEVPAGWATNAVHCGMPQRDTVIINVQFIETCLPPNVPQVESLEISEGRAFLDGAETIDTSVDGIEAERVPTTCTTGRTGFDQPDGPAITTCTGALYFPDDDVTFSARSTTDRQRVDDLLATVHVDEGRIGVPAYAGLIELQARSGDAYVERLSAAGFDVQVRRQLDRSIPGGFVRGIEPGVGTMLKPGSTVVVTISADRVRLVDQVELNVSAWPEGQELTELDDEQARSGGVLTVPVGTEVWSPVSGPRAADVVAELEGIALVPSGGVDSPNPGRTWRAATVGTSTVRLFLEISGRRTSLGYFRVVVTP